MCVCVWVGVGVCMCVCVHVSDLCSVLNIIPERAVGETQEKYETFVRFKFFYWGQLRYETVSRPPWRNSPYWARASTLSRLHDHTQTHHTR